jgi:hypothetical protein
VIAHVVAAPAPAPGRFALGTRAGITVVSTALTAAPVLTVPDASDPSWSPDGTQLAFSRPAGLGVAAADGSGARAVTTAPIATTKAELQAPGFFADTSPSWSPNGRRLVFVRATLKRSDIWTVLADGSGAHRVLAATGRDRIDTAPQFFAGSLRVHFTRDDGDFWGARLDGRAPMRLVAANGAEVVAAPDGGAYALGWGGGGVYTVKRDGHELRRIAAPHNRPIAFSSDSRNVLLSHGDGSTSATAAVLADATGVRPAHTVASAPEGLPSLGFGPASWFAPGPPPHRTPTVDHEAPVSILATSDGRMVALDRATARLTVPLSPFFASLTTIDQTGIRSIAAAWVRGHERPRWRDATGAGAFARTVPRTVAPGRTARYRLLVRATDVLGHTTKHPAETIVKLTG